MVLWHPDPQSVSGNAQQAEPTAKMWQETCPGDGQGSKSPSVYLSPKPGVEKSPLFLKKWNSKNKTLPAA